MKTLSAFFIVIIITMNICVTTLADEVIEEYIEDLDYCETGELLMTDEEMKNFKESVPQIINVLPNKTYYERLIEENVALLEESNAYSYNMAEYGEEIVTDTEVNDSILMGNESMDIPKRVDNSDSYTFPRIGNQGELSACVAWSIAYYQLTNNMNRIRGTLARNDKGINISSNVCSPNWIYNLGNDGVDGGMNVHNAANIIYIYGCPTIDRISLKNYVYNDTMYRTWYPSKDVWEGALNNKCDIYYESLNPTGLSTFVTTPECIYLNNLKKILANGYVVTISTKVNSSENPYLPIVKLGMTSEQQEEYVWTEIRNRGNGHSVTIVGYDDSFYVDINENGMPEDGEYGAFKIANSWGIQTRNHNKGFVWLSYDALNSHSSVLETKHVERVPAVKGYAYYLLIPRKTYQPLLTASVKINTRYRDFLEVYLGIEDVENSENFYEKIITETPYMKKDTRYAPFGHFGNLFNLSGGNGFRSDFITFDFSTLLRNFKMEKDRTYNVYIKLRDVKITGLENVNTATVETFVLKDHYTGQTYTSSNTPLSTSNTVDEIKVGVEYTSSIDSVKSDKSISIAFNSKVNEDTISDGNIILVDSDDENVNVDFSLSESKKNIILSPSKHTFYKSGFYNLSVLSDLKSIGGNSFSPAYEKLIYVPFH